MRYEHKDRQREHSLFGCEVLISVTIKESIFWNISFTVHHNVIYQKTELVKYSLLKAY
jgi:hypothetical protein